jgi:hypothetical protein
LIRCLCSIWEITYDRELDQLRARNAKLEALLIDAVRLVKDTDKWISDDEYRPFPSIKTRMDTFIKQVNKMTGGE